MSSQGREEYPSSSSSSLPLRAPRARSSEEQQAPHVDGREQQQYLQPHHVIQQQQPGLGVEPSPPGERNFQREQASAATQEEEQQQLVRALQLQEQQQSCYSSRSSGDHVPRTCFICLEGAKRNKRDHSKRRDLHSCCTQCYVVVHRNCWAAYRRRQQLAAFRARLLGQRAPTPHLCSICKTGRAGVTGDPPLLPRGGKRRRSGEAAAPSETAAAGQRGRNSSVLQEQLLASLGRLLQDDDEDADRPPLCTGLCMCINTGVLVAVLLVDLLLMALTYIYPLQVLLLSLFLCYNAIVIQILILAIRQRREYMRTYLTAGSEGVENTDGSDASSSSSGSSGGRRGSDELRVSSGAADEPRSRRRSFEEEEYHVYTAEEEQEGELLEDASAAGGGGAAAENSTHVLRSVFLSFSSSPSNSSSSAGRRQGNSSSGSSYGRRRRSSSSSSRGASRREAFLRVNERETGTGESRIGELWTAAKSFYFSLFRDAWRWTERSASAVGEPLAGGGWRNDAGLQEDLGTPPTAPGEYYTRAEAAVEAQLAADVEMQVLDFDEHPRPSAAGEPQRLRQIPVRSS